MNEQQTAHQRILQQNRHEIVFVIAEPAHNAAERFSVKSDNGLHRFGCEIACGEIWNRFDLREEFFQMSSSVVVAGLWRPALQANEMFRLGFGRCNGFNGVHLVIRMVLMVHSSPSRASTWRLHFGH